MVKLLFLMTGGALGTIARYGVSGLAHRMTDTLFPLGTLVVNAVGSLLIGIVWALWEDSSIPGYIRTFLMIGFFGGFTTFSSFSLETLNLIRDNDAVYGSLQARSQDRGGPVTPPVTISIEGHIFEHQDAMDQSGMEEFPVGEPGQTAQTVKIG